jgi:hypothetical protein
MMSRLKSSRGYSGTVNISVFPFIRPLLLLYFWQIVHSLHTFLTNLVTFWMLLPSSLTSAKVPAIPGGRYLLLS